MRDSRSRGTHTRSFAKAVIIRRASQRSPRSVSPISVAREYVSGPSNMTQNGCMARNRMTSWPDLIFEKLREFGIRHVAYVPDAGLARLIELCQAAADMEPTVLTTEEEGIGILAGAWLAGSAAPCSCKAAAWEIASTLFRS